MDTSKDTLPTIVVIGRPNSGKSTLINSLLDQKVAITSPKPQTTRKNKSYLYSSEDGYFYITDTPGILGRVKDTLSKSINKQPQKTLSNPDVVIYLVDISRPWGDEEAKSLGMVRKISSKKILVYNKADKAVGTKNYLAQYNFLESEFDYSLQISALKKTHLKSLLELIFKCLPTQDPKLAPPKSNPLLDINSYEFISELIREKALLTLRKEVPFTVNVVVRDIREHTTKNILEIYADIETTHDRYKKMIIGHGGHMIKSIGTMSRKELELLSRRHVFLKLNVIVNKHWQEAYL